MGHVPRITWFIVTLCPASMVLPLTRLLGLTRVCVFLILCVLSVHSSPAEVRLHEEYFDTTNDLHESSFLEQSRVDQGEEDAYYSTESATDDLASKNGIPSLRLQLTKKFIDSITKVLIFHGFDRERWSNVAEMIIPKDYTNLEVGGGLSLDFENITLTSFSKPNLETMLTEDGLLLNAADSRVTAELDMRYQFPGFIRGLLNNKATVQCISRNTSFQALFRPCVAVEFDQWQMPIDTWTKKWFCLSDLKKRGLPSIERIRSDLSRCSSLNEAEIITSEECDGFDGEHLHYKTVNDEKIRFRVDPRIRLLVAGNNAALSFDGGLKLDVRKLQYQLRGLLHKQVIGILKLGGIEKLVGNLLTDLIQWLMDSYFGGMMANTLDAIIDNTISVLNSFTKYLTGNSFDYDLNSIFLNTEVILKEDRLILDMNGPLFNIDNWKFPGMSEEQKWRWFDSPHNWYMTALRKSRKKCAEDQARLRSLWYHLPRPRFWFKAPPMVECTDEEIMRQLSDLADALDKSIYDQDVSAVRPVKVPFSLNITSPLIKNGYLSILRLFRRNRLAKEKKRAHDDKVLVDMLANADNQLEIDLKNVEIR